MYERGRHDLARSRRHRYCLKALASTASPPHSSNQSSRTKSVPARGRYTGNPQEFEGSASREMKDGRKDADGGDYALEKRGRSPLAHRSSTDAENPNKGPGRAPSRTHSMPPDTNRDRGRRDGSLEKSHQGIRNRTNTISIPNRERSDRHHQEKIGKSRSQSRVFGDGERESRDEHLEHRHDSQHNPKHNRSTTDALRKTLIIW